MMYDTIADTRDERVMQDTLPLIRSHFDGLGDIMSLEAATINDEPSLTHTEFTDDANIDNILERYRRGENVNRRVIKSGETIDYTMDLQQALHAVGDMEAAHRVSVPPELQNIYPTWREWLNAASNGSYEHELSELTKRKAAAEAKRNPPAETPPLEGGAGPTT